MNTKRFLLALLVVLGLVGAFGYTHHASAAGPTFTGTASTAFTYSGTATGPTATAMVTGVTGQHVYIQSLVLSKPTAGPIAIYDGTILIMSLDLGAAAPYSLPHEFFFTSTGTGGASGPGPNGYQIGSGSSLGVLSPDGVVCYVTGIAANN